MTWDEVRQHRIDHPGEPIPLDFDDMPGVEAKVIAYMEKHGYGSIQEAFDNLMTEAIAVVILKQPRPEDL